MPRDDMERFVNSIQAKDLIARRNLGCNLDGAIVAGTTQTQAGAEPIMAGYGIISTCANEGDGVKLPVIVNAGVIQFVKNEGALGAQVWPGSGDDLDGGADDAVDANTLLPGETRAYYASAVGSWVTLNIGNRFLGNQTEVVTTTNVITAAENGKTFILNSATAFVSTLPTAAKGLKFRFVAGATQVTGGNHTIVTADSANVIEGSLYTPETPTTAVSVVAAADTVSFIADKMVEGDYCELECIDGTNWHLTGHTFVQDGMTSTQAS